MGLFDAIKDKFSGQKKDKQKEEELKSYLKSSHDNLKQSFDYLTKFLESMRGYQPARRHEALYFEGVKSRLISIRAGLGKGVSYLNEKMNNEINTLNDIKSPTQLVGLIGTWCNILKIDDENAKDYVLYYLKEEMWSEEKAKRGFPVPQNKELLLNYLDGSVTLMKEARDHLENFNSGQTPQ